ncbi:DUF2913 family protein [Serratia fonticola]|uniref:DUF2913 family protein n=1 Tax=Serratia fonticola TaxID=47917 RepID=UPI0015C5CD69|nr:DUF2913 family protein [Serratia fonticola]MBC3381130.1 DUF2913 family protein [Serratia fonticola]NYA40329.1 DUF2913 family protein [Serratia fonticola]
MEKTLVDDTRSARDLSHLVFCALVALYSSQQTSVFAENLFLVRWLMAAQKQKRFSKTLALDIQWMMTLSEEPGIILRNKLESLWAASSGSKSLQPYPA